MPVLPRKQRVSGLFAGVATWALALGYVLTLSPDAAADEFHADNFRFGQRAMAMGGAVIGQLVEPTASYYNPGGLGFLRGAVFSGSVQFHGLDKRTLIGGARSQGFAPQDAVSESFLALPASSVATHEFGGGKHRFAYSTFLFSTHEERFGGGFKDAFDVDANVRADRAITASTGVRDKILWIGPSYADRVNERLAIGISGFFVRRETTLDTLDDYEEQHTENSDGKFVRTIFTHATTSTQLVDAALLLRLGAMWRPDSDTSVGACLSTESFNLSGEAKQRFTVTSSGDPLAQLPEDRAPQRSGFTLDDDTARTVYPWRLAVGASRRFDGTLLLAFSGSADLPVDYQRLGIGDAESAETGVVNQISKQLTLNGSIGLQWQAAEHWPIRAGIFTNRSSAPEVPESAELPSPEHVDLYGATFSVGYRDDRRAINVGLEGQWGSGQQAVRDRLAGPESPWVRVSREQYRVIVFLSGATQLAKRKATDYGKDKARKIQDKMREKLQSKPGKPTPKPKR